MKTAGQNSPAVFIKCLQKNNGILYNYTMTKQKFSAVLFFLSYFKPHRKLFIADMCCSVFIAGIDLLFPVLTRYTINTLLPDQLYHFFYIMIALMIGMYLLHTAASYFVAYFGHVFGVLVETDMRRDIFDHIEKQSFSFFDNHRTGHLMSRVTYDLFEITELAHHGPEDLLLSAATLIGSFIIMLTIRWELALIIFTLLPLMIFFTARSRNKLNKSSRTVKEKTAEINASIESSISGARVTKVFTNEAFENERFARGNEAFLNAKCVYYRSMAGFHCKIDFATHILNVLVLGAGGFFIMNGRMNLADLVAANLFVAAFLQPIRRLSNFVEQFTTGMAGFKRFTEIMNTHCETPELPDAPDLMPVNGNISYEHVSFAYNNNVSVLHDINFSLKAGQKIALVGPSGGGKTTLCHLLPRFYEIDSGRITIDGTDIRSVTVKSLRQQIGLVQQDVFMFAGTIKDNIAYGCTDATDAQIEAAARRAEIHQDIMKMPAGYNTIVGEQGVKLSGGQKQRISIARIFLKNPPILILDEATSALDSATEVKIQQAFDELAKGRTTLVIAHRLSTIRNADMILVVTEAGIIESGNHAQLMASGGLYKSLYLAQFDFLSAAEQEQHFQAANSTATGSSDN